jgi:hypothetical protein
MEYPKMLYKASGTFADQEAIKAGLMTGQIQYLIVNSADEQKAAKGWTEDLASLVTQAVVQ